MKLSLTIFILLITANIYGQDFTNRKSIYLEVGGSAGFGSINYENVFAQKKNVDLLWRVGVTGFFVDGNNGLVLVVPATFGALIGQGKNKLELGIGQGLSVSTKGQFFALTTPILGYRYENREKRYFFRISYTPLISYILDFQYQNWGGVSLGYHLNFKK